MAGGGVGLQFLNYPFGDTTFTKIFVGGLAWETQSHTLHHYFEQFGEILEAVVITDKNTGRSRGYGFVTFRDPESARRACVDPSPVIDGRRANCNLASLGRPRPASPFGRIRSAPPSFGSVHTPRGAYIRNPNYHQPVSYGYQPGYMYPPYGYTTYGPEYVYPQGVYNPYVGQNYLQVYGVPGTGNAGVYSYGQLGHPLPGSQGHTTFHGYGMPSHRIVQFGGPNVNGATTVSMPPIQTPYPTAASAPGLAPIVIPVHSPQVTQGSSSDQTSS